MEPPVKERRASSCCGSKANNSRKPQYGRIQYGHRSKTRFLCWKRTVNVCRRIVGHTALVTGQACEREGAVLSPMTDGIVVEDSGRTMGREREVRTTDSRWDTHGERICRLMTQMIQDFDRGMLGQVRSHFFRAFHDQKFRGGVCRRFAFFGRDTPRNKFSSLEIRNRLFTFNLQKHLSRL